MKLGQFVIPVKFGDDLGGNGRDLVIDLTYRIKDHGIRPMMSRRDDLDVLPQRPGMDFCFLAHSEPPHVDKETPEKIIPHRDPDALKFGDPTHSVTDIGRISDTGLDGVTVDTLFGKFGDLAH